MCRLLWDLGAVDSLSLWKLPLESGSVPMETKYLAVRRYLQHEKIAYELSLDKREDMFKSVG